MPEISRFYGIVIAMYFHDHPPPHFHARYGSEKAKISVDPVSVLDGSLPPRAMGLVIEWATLHQSELLECFSAVMEHRQPPKVAPLQ